MLYGGYKQTGSVANRCSYNTVWSAKTQVLMVTRGVVVNIRIELKLEALLVWRRGVAYLYVKQFSCEPKRPPSDLLVTTFIFELQGLLSAVCPNQGSVRPRLLYPSVHRDYTKEFSSCSSIVLIKAGGGQARSPVKLI